MFREEMGGLPEAIQKSLLKQIEVLVRNAARSQKYLQRDPSQPKYNEGDLISGLTAIFNVADSLKKDLDNSN